MAKYYKLYFLFYGGLHFLAGLAFWLIPDLTRLFLKTPLAPDAAALMGFASALAGLGFTGVAFVTMPSHQKRVIFLSVVGNLLNLAVHVQNVIRGYAPPSLIWLAGVSILGMSFVLFFIHKDIY